MHNHFFITGTDTGAGKTLVTAALMVALQSKGIRCLPVKPVQCGSGTGMEDLDWCLQFSTLVPSPSEKKDLNLYRFKLAASPHLAARHEGVTISTQQIASAIKDLTTRYDSLVIEGAGGLLVPLNDHETVLDLIKLTLIRPVVVTRANLGTLNHTALTLRELDRAGIKPAAVVVNEAVQAKTEEEMMIRDDNIIQITRMAASAPVVVFPHLRDITVISLRSAGLLLVDVLNFT